MDFKKNDLVTVTIEDMGHEGEGIGKVEGYTFFIKDALLGDVVQAKVMKAKKQYAYARLMEIVKPSPYRVTPKCPMHAKCGGCQIQALDYSQQLVFKENKIRNNLKRIGGFVDIPMEPIVGMEEPYFYRNKAQFPIGEDKDGNPIAGFYAGRTHTIIPNTRCYLGVEVNEEILNRVLAYMKQYRVPAYREMEHTGLVRHVLIRYGFRTKEIMVCLVVNGSKLPREDKLIASLTEIPGMTSIMLNTNKEKTNVILGKELRTLWGKSYITDCLKDICYQISPLSFYQVNPKQTEKLYELALSYAGLTGRETVWDLYCGIGTISLFLAKQAKQVFGVESVPEAIEDAKKNAALNDIGNVDFFVGKAEEVFTEYCQEHPDAYADVIVVDPPRKGCDAELLATILKIRPERVVYVSCDSATLARDLKILCEGGYRLEKVRGVDQFGMTVHVETVVKLSLKKDTPKIEVTMEPDEESNYTPEEKATYQKIKNYVKDKYGVNVHTSYIAQVKRMCGLDMGENYNKSKKENPEVKKCPQEKVEYIKDALRQYNMI